MANYIVFGTTSKQSMGKIMQAILATNSSLKNYWLPYGWVRGCRIEYIIDIPLDNLDRFINLARSNYIEPAERPIVNG